MQNIDLTNRSFKVLMPMSTPSWGMFLTAKHIGTEFQNAIIHATRADKPEWSGLLEEFAVDYPWSIDLCRLQRQSRE